MDNRTKLEEALQRLIKGNPKNIDKNRKITPSAVEDEAKVSRSLLRSEIYSDIFKETNLIKEEQKKKTSEKNNGSANKTTSVNPEVKAIKKELNKEKDKVRKLKETNQNLMQTNAELFSLLISIDQDARLKKQLEKAVNSTTNVNISKAIIELLRKD